MPAQLTVNIMKIRNGFVSNSSSSSFIVAADKNANAEIRIVIPLKECSTVLKTKKDVEEWLSDNKGYTLETLKEEAKDNSWAKELLKAYEQMIKAVENKKIVYEVRASSDGEGYEQMLYNIDPDVLDIEGGEVILNEPN